MSETNTGLKTLNQQIFGGITVAVCSAVLASIISLSASNNQRDASLVELKTTVKDMNERLTKEHDDDVKQLAEIEAQLKQVQIDTARISQKVGVSASPGQR